MWWVMCKRGGWDTNTRATSGIFLLGLFSAKFLTWPFLLHCRFHVEVSLAFKCWVFDFCPCCHYSWSLKNRLLYPGSLIPRAYFHTVLRWQTNGLFFLISQTFCCWVFIFKNKLIPFGCNYKGCCFTLNVSWLLPWFFSGDNPVQSCKQTDLWNRSLSHLLVKEEAKWPGNFFP